MIDPLYPAKPPKICKNKKKSTIHPLPPDPYEKPGVFQYRHAKAENASAESLPSRIISIA